MTPIGPEDLRAAAVAVILYYLPGFPLAHRLARAAGGRALHWALPCSWALLLGGLFLARLGGLDLSGATWVLAMTVALGLAAGLALRRREPAPAGARGAVEGALGGSSSALRTTSPASDAVRPFEWALLGASALTLLAVGGPLNILFDSLDHLTAIRRSWLSGAILPPDLFYRGGDGAGWDPRKGFLHPLHAFVCTAAGVDPLHLWRVLPAVLAPGVILAISRFLGAWTGPGRRRDVALALWILFGSGSGFLWLTRAGYPNHVAYPLALLGAGLLVEEAAGPARPGRLAGLAVLGFVGTLIHVFAGVLLLFALGLAGLAALLRPEDRAERLRRLARASAAIAAGIVAPLVFRLLTQGPAESELHTHPQGILFLGRGLMLASPFFIVWHVGAAGLLGLCLLPWAAGRLGGSRRALLLAFTLVPWICVWTPLFTPLYRAIGYLVPRFLEIVPVPVVLGLAAEGALACLRRPRRPWSGLAAGAALAALLVVVVRGLCALPAEVRGAARDAHGAATPRAFSRALAAIPPAGRGAAPPVVLADPFTSYAVGGMTGAHVVATLNQHGPPNDLRWRDRIDDQRDMLQGTGGDGRADSLLDAYQVDLVFVNAALPLPMREFGLRVDSTWVRNSLRRFSSDPARFPVRYEGPEGLVVSVRRAAPPAPPAGATSPQIAAEGGTAASSPREAPRRAARSPGPFRFAALPGLEAADVELPADPVPRGGRIPIRWRWVRTGEVPTDLPFTVRARMQTAVPRRWYSRDAWSKLARLLTQRLDRVLYRHMDGQPPFHGTRNPARLPIGVPQPDSLVLHVPKNAAPGRWEITLALVPETFLPNVRLRDLLRDDDNITGPSVGSVTVE